MAIRPVVLKFVFGKGLVKRRRESDDTSRFIAEQVAINYANKTFTESMETLKASILRDVRRELDHLHRQFFKFIIGLPAAKTAPTGRLTTVAQSPGGNPSMNIRSGIPSWAPRNAKYLNKKFLTYKTKAWWVRTGDLKRTMAPMAGEGLDGGETLFEEIFGPVSVTIKRNIKEWGAAGGKFTTGVLRHNKPGTKAGRAPGSDDPVLAAGTRERYGSPTRGNRTRVHLQLGTVVVRALGSLNPGAITRESLYGEGGAVSRWNEDVAIKLGGRATKYRPTLEPFLNFFLEKSLAHAVSERIRRGTVASSLKRAGR
jgi:hypothetical protein